MRHGPSSRICDLAGRHLLQPLSRNKDLTPGRIKYLACPLRWSYPARAGLQVFACGLHYLRAHQRTSEARKLSRIGKHRPVTLSREVAALGCTLVDSAQWIGVPPFFRRRNLI